MTDLEGTPAQISNGYAHRMDIEELFRDKKNKFNGWSLRHTRIIRADRLDRLLLILALAYILFCGLGLLARSRCRPSCGPHSGRGCFRCFGWRDAVQIAIDFQHHVTHQCVHRKNVTK